MPSTALIASGTDAEICVGARLHVLGGAGVADGVELAGVAQALDRLRQVVEEVAHAPDERHEQQQREQQDEDGGAEHGHGRGEAAGQVGLRHHEAHRVLEHEPEEDPDEHDQERVADRPERGEHAERGGDEQDRPHREDELDAPTRRRGSCRSLPNRCASPSGPILASSAWPRVSSRPWPRWKRPRPLRARVRALFLLLLGPLGLLLGHLDLGVAVGLSDELLPAAPSEHENDEDSATRTFQAVVMSCCAVE